MTGNEPIRIVVPIACKGTTANEGRSVHIGGCVRCVHWAGARRLYAAHKRVQNAQRARRVYATMHAHVGSPARTLQVWACETMAFSGAGVVLGLAYFYQKHICAVQGSRPPGDTLVHASRALTRTTEP